MMRFGDNPVALVTGAGAGIGSAVALELARRGFDLIVNDRATTPSLQEVVKSVQEQGRSCEILASDVFSASSRIELVSKATEIAGSLDVLVSNPAKNIRRPILDLELTEFESVIASTLTSGFHLAQLVARCMIERGRSGKIVFISSVHAEMPLKGNVAYNAAKAGLNHLVATAAAEMCEFKINVNAVAPGWIDTPGERAVGGESIEEVGRSLPWGRIGSPQDVAKAVAFLCSDDAEYITGAILPVDGGFRFRQS